MKRYKVIYQDRNGNVNHVFFTCGAEANECIAKAEISRYNKGKLNASDIEILAIKEMV